MADHPCRSGLWPLCPWQPRPYLISAGGRAFPIYSQASAPTGGTFHQAIFTTGYGFTQDEMLEPLMSSAGETPIPGIKSDHPMRQRGELDNIPPNRQKPEAK